MEKPSKGRIVTEIAIEMRKAIISLAGERGWNETRERWLERAATKAGVSYRTAKSIFYSELRDPRTSVVTLVRHAIERKSASQEISARDDLAALEIRMRALEARLNAMDQDGAGAPFDAIGEGDGVVGGSGGAVD